MSLANDALAQCGGGVPDIACGDVNSDGIVDTDDWNLCVLWQGCDTGCCPGDANWDGKTDGADLGIIATETGQFGYQPVPLVIWDPNCYTAFVTVRPISEAPSNGLLGRDYTEDEFGARVELAIRNPAEGTEHLRHVQITSSAAGYLNQNQYPLHFGLPPDPSLEETQDLHFDVYVDFPTRANEGNDPNEGPWRVDWTVNPALADINLADLYANCEDPNTLGRPITIYRDGRVVMKRGDHLEPNDSYQVGAPTARLYTLGGPLRLPDPALPALESPIAGNVIAGVRFIKGPDSPKLRVREIIVDGQLDQTTSGCAFNVVVLDVTNPAAPVLVGGLKAVTFSSNRRTFIHVPPGAANDFILPANDSVTTRLYEVRARMTSQRANTLPNPTGLQTPLGIVVDKGLIAEPSTGKDVCTEPMALDTVVQSPVIVRLSQAAN